MRPSERVDNAYAAYQEHATEATLNGLYRSVRIYAQRIVTRRNVPDAEDVVSDAVTGVWMSLTGPRKLHVPMSAWVWMITMRTIGKARRTAKRKPLQTNQEPHVIEHGLLTHAQSNVAQAAALTEDEQHRAKEARTRKAASLGLTANQADLLQRIIETPDYEAVAREMGIPLKKLYDRVGLIRRKIERNRERSIAAGTYDVKAVPAEL